MIPCNRYIQSEKTFLAQKIQLSKSGFGEENVNHGFK